MTNGLCAPNLKSSALQNVDLETARRYRHGDLVVCSEREKTYGPEVTISFVDYWRMRFYRYLCEIDLGFVQIRWRKLRYTTADKIVEGGDHA